MPIHFNFDAIVASAAHLVLAVSCSLFVYPIISAIRLKLLQISGRTPYLYRHDLVALTQRNLTQRISKPMNKIPEKYLPKRLAITTRLPETKYVANLDHTFCICTFHYVKQKVPMCTVFKFKNCAHGQELWENRMVQRYKIVNKEYQRL